MCMLVPYLNWELDIEKPPSVPTTVPSRIHRVDLGSLKHGMNYGTAEKGRFPLLF